MIGQRFGNYRAVSLLGEGGMGAVYLAEHPEIGRRVAVKVLRQELIRDPQLLVRFMNEARAANAIRHPNIIEVLDSGTNAEGVPYLVMELLEGESLASRIRRTGKLAVREALEFAYQSASALNAAHGKGIVHRDLKPDNIFVVRDVNDPAREMVKVLDFGIAKLQTMPTGAGMQTRTGTLMGTPVYMSPEQCLGTKTVDHRSDIYALGIIMFEMLAGRPPFYSEGFGELVNMHLNVRPPSLHDLNPSVTPPVQALIEKALEKHPDNRQRSAAELQGDIRGAAGKSIMLRVTSSPDLIADTLPGSMGGHTRVMPTSTASMPVASTTMTGSTGERFPSSLTLPIKRGRGGVVAVVLLLLAAGGGGVWWGTRHLRDSGGKDDPGRGLAGRGADAGTISGRNLKDPGEDKPPATVRLAIDSDPQGATVTEIDSGTDLGTTPLLLVRPPATKPLAVKIAKTGFMALTRELDMVRDGHETFALASVPAAAGKTTEPPHGAGKSGKNPGANGGKKDHANPHHGKTTTPAEDEPAKL